MMSAKLRACLARGNQASPGGYEDDAQIEERVERLTRPFQSRSENPPGEIDNL